MFECIAGTERTGTSRTEARRRRTGPSGASSGPVSMSTWIARLVVFLFVASGCASIHVTGRDDYQGDKLARPDRILVHDFAAAVEDLPAWSDASARMTESGLVRTDPEIAAGRRLGEQMAGDLVARIRKMGLDAERMTPESAPVPGDVVIVGLLTSIDEGDSTKRVVLGFGSGAAEIATELEGYLATENGFEKLSSGRAESVKARGPGVAVPIAMSVVTSNPLSLILGLPVKVAGEATGRSTIEGVSRRMVDEIAGELEKKFRAQEWIE